MRSKQRQAVLDYWLDPNGPYGKERNAKVSQSLKGRDDIQEALAQAREKRWEGKVTVLEQKVMDVLDLLGVSFIFQFRPRGSYRVYDMLLVDYHVLVEVDGDMWHHSEWVTSHTAVETRDIEKEQWALDHGYGFMRLEECMIKDMGFASQLGQALNVGA